MQVASDALMLLPPGLSDASMPLDGIHVTAWVPGAMPVAGSVLEMSPRDVKLVLDEDLPPGSIIELELTSSLHEFSVAIRGVAHWRHADESGAVVGVFLNSALPHDVVGHYWCDLRKELRYACEWSCGLYLPRQRRRHRATLLNYSRSGLMLETDAAVHEQDQIQLADAAPLDAPPIVTGVVRWRTPRAPGIFILGCELHDEQGQRLAAYLRSVGACG
jgi:hypothetical protein